MSLAPDYVVEVRDINLVKRGQIAPERLNLMFIEAFNSVGSWQLKLPAEHPMLAYLKVKGSGIIVTDRVANRTYSGRTHSAKLSQDAEDPTGTWVIDGYDDNVVAAASLVYPEPGAAADAQTEAYWTRALNAEQLMKAVVRQNVGPDAIAARKYSWLTSSPNLSRGGTISVSFRFDNMADALTSMGARGGLGWRFAQVGSAINFDVYETADKTATVRLDVRNGGLESTELGWTAPSASQVLVLGQGEGADRTVLPVSTSASLAEAAAWGLRWEVAKDQRNTDDPTEMQQAGEEILLEKGMTTSQIKVTPSDAPNMRVGKDYWLGDKITVMIDGTPTQATLTEVAISITSEGVIKQITIGDPVGFDWEAKVGKQLDDHEQRVSDLESNVEAGVTWASIKNKPYGIRVTDWNNVRDEGHYWSYAGDGVNNPSPNWYMGEVKVFGDRGGSNERIIQTLQRPDTVGINPEIWQRSWSSGGGWTPWVQILKRVATSRTPNATQSIPTATWTTVLWQTQIDSWGGFTYDTSTGYITISDPGVYSITGQVQLGTNATGRRLTRIRNVSGGGLLRQYEAAPLPANSTTVPFVWQGYLDVGTQLAFEVYQNSGGALSLVSNTEGSSFNITRIST